MVSDTIRPELVEFLRGVMAPWDSRAWDSFRDHHPDAAAFLLDLVAAGGTNEDIRGYCEREGYTRGAADWLVHAAEHLRRNMAQQQEPDPQTIDLPTAPAVEAQPWPGPEQGRTKGRAKRIVEPLTYITGTPVVDTSDPAITDPRITGRL